MSDTPRFVLCIQNEGYPASLELRKVYRALDDPAGERDGLLRVVDESGEDYLYPAEFFVPIEVPEKAEKVFGAKHSPTGRGSRLNSRKEANGRRLTRAAT